jgi:hypothetical protein
MPMELARCPQCNVSDIFDLLHELSLTSRRPPLEVGSIRSWPASRAQLKWRTEGPEGHTKKLEVEKLCAIVAAPY